MVVRSSTTKVGGVVELKCPGCNGNGRLYSGPDAPLLDLNPDLYEEVECHRCFGTGDYIPFEEFENLTKEDYMKIRVVTEEDKV